MPYSSLADDFRRLDVEGLGPLLSHNALPTSSARTLVFLRLRGRPDPHFMINFHLQAEAPAFMDERFLDCTGTSELINKEILPSEAFCPSKCTFCPDPLLFCPALYVRKCSDISEDLWHLGLSDRSFEMEGIRTFFYNCCLCCRRERNGWQTVFEAGSQGLAEVQFISRDLFKFLTRGQHAGSTVRRHVTGSNPSD